MLEEIFDEKERKAEENPKSSKRRFPEKPPKDSVLFCERENVRSIIFASFTDAEMNSCVGE